MSEQVGISSTSISTNDSAWREDVTAKYSLVSEEIYSPRQLLNYIRYARKPTVEMLQDTGVIFNVMCRLDNETLDCEPFSRLVCFDKLYVVQKLAFDMSLILDEMSQQEWEDLMYKVYQEGQSNKEKSEAEASK
jgi:hypothetical protein